MPRTSTRVDISIPSPLAETYLSAQKAGKVRPRSEVCTDALEDELRRNHLEVPPRPEPNPQTARAAATRWAPKLGTKKKKPTPERTP